MSIVPVTAMLFHGPNRPWEKVELASPEPKEGEIRVRILACTICGSDLHSVSGRRTVPTPSILGHEMVGQIESFGPNANRISVDQKPLHVGDSIVWSLVADCGSCFYCRRDLPQKCEKAFKYGHHRFDQQHGLSGGFATHCMLVPGTRIVALPVDLPFEIACPVGCATATIVAAIEQLHVRPGDRALVLGAGMLGLTACAMLQTLGSSEVICVEKNESRRNLALQFGATMAVQPEALEQVVHDRCGGYGVDCLVECTGSNQAFESAFPQVRIGGRIALVGAVFPQPGSPIVLERIVRKNLTIAGIHNYKPMDLVNAVQFLADHKDRFPFSTLVASWYNLDDIEKAMHHSQSQQGVRVGVIPRIP